MDKYNIYFTFKKKEQIDQSIKELFETFTKEFYATSCYKGWKDFDKKENNLEKSMKVEVMTDLKDKDIKELCEKLKKICDQQSVRYYKTKVKEVVI